jgi:hypothetical protein
MTRRAELTALAERVMGLSGADREVDCRAWCAKQDSDFALFARIVPDFLQWQAPFYTASLDAAMSLVPKGWALDGLSFWPASPEDAANTSPDQSRATLMQVSVTRMGRDMIYGHGSKDATVKAEASTPALALTAAALLALAEAEQ